MIVVTVAHHLEARFLIEALDLKQMRSISARQVFENDTLRLVISGIGSINSAVATTIAFSSFSLEGPCAAVNFGICGSAGAHDPGTLLQAHSIYANASQRNFYPDMILSLDLPQASLETRERPYIAGESAPLAKELVDMEAAGFFEAAKSFVSPERIFILKLVSDHGQSFEEIRSRLPALIDAQTPRLRELLKTIESWIQEKQDLTATQREMLSEVCAHLKLTESQYQKLLFLCRARGPEGDTIKRLEPFLQQNYSHRQQRSELFSELVDALAIPLI